MKDKSNFSVIPFLLIVALIFSCATEPETGGNNDGGNNEPKKYNLIVGKATDGNGSGSISKESTASGSYTERTSIMVEAFPSYTSFFFGWYDAPEGGNLISRKPKYRLNLYNDTALYARFDFFIINIEDAVLEQAVRDNLKQPTGSLEYENLSKITSLDSWGNSTSKISSLKGIEYLTGLNTLNLGSNSITDITPLANLQQLVTLNLRENGITNITALTNLPILRNLYLEMNDIEDISPLKNLTNISTVYLSSNKITDISPISSILFLRTLSLENNTITDISPLANQKYIRALNIGYNGITNLEPLTNLINISDLFINGNGITDITPLLNNTGIGAGDMITLETGNTIPATQITTLKDKGVHVF